MSRPGRSWDIPQDNAFGTADNSLRSKVAFRAATRGLTRMDAPGSHPIGVSRVAGSVAE